MTSAVNTFLLGVVGAAEKLVPTGRSYENDSDIRASWNCSSRTSYNNVRSSFRWESESLTRPASRFVWTSFASKLLVTGSAGSVPRSWEGFQTHREYCCRARSSNPESMESISSVRKHRKRIRLAHFVASGPFASASTASLPWSLGRPKSQWALRSLIALSTFHPTCCGVGMSASPLGPSAGPGNAAGSSE